MSMSDAKRAANAAYQRRQDALTVRPSKDTGAQIRAAAAAAGQSAQAYILQACAERMQRDGFTSSPADSTPATEERPTT